MELSGKEWDIIRITLKMLIGEFTHTIDDKNRISLPSKFRSILGKKVVVTSGLDQCLWVFTNQEWNKIADRLSDNSSMLSADARNFGRYMFGGASEAEVDSAGRILVPDFLRERANLKNKVVLIGVKNRVEIWNEKSWTDCRKQIEKSADGLAEKLSGLGIM